MGRVASESGPEIPTRVWAWRWSFRTRRTASQRRCCRRAARGGGGQDLAKAAPSSSCAIPSPSPGSEDPPWLVARASQHERAVFVGRCSLRRRRSRRSRRTPAATPAAATPTPAAAALQPARRVYRTAPQRTEARPRPVRSAAAVPSARGGLLRLLKHRRGRRQLRHSADARFARLCPGGHLGPRYAAPDPRRRAAPAYGHGPLLLLVLPRPALAQVARLRRVPAPCSSAAAVHDVGRPDRGTPPLPRRHGPPRVGVLSTSLPAPTAAALVRRPAFTAAATVAAPRPHPRGLLARPVRLRVPDESRLGRSSAARQLARGQSQDDFVAGAGSCAGRERRERRWIVERGAECAGYAQGAECDGLPALSVRIFLLRLGAVLGPRDFSADLAASFAVDKR